MPFVDGFTFNYDEETGKITSIFYEISGDYQTVSGYLNISSSAMLIQKTCLGENIVMITLSDLFGYHSVDYEDWPEDSYSGTSATIYLLYNLQTKEVLQVTRDYINTHVDVQPELDKCDVCGNWC